MRMPDEFTLRIVSFIPDRQILVLDFEKFMSLSAVVENEDLLADLISSEFGESIDPHPIINDAQDDTTDYHVNDDGAEKEDTTYIAMPTTQYVAYQKLTCAPETVGGTHGIARRST